MNLRDYLHFERISVTEMAKQLQISRSYLNRIVLEQMRPSKQLAKHIELLTNGKVKAKELLKEKENGMV